MNNIYLKINVKENNKWAFERIVSELNKGYTGKLELNCFMGGVAAINKFESIKPNHDHKKEGSQ